MSGMVISAKGDKFDSYLVDYVYVGSPAQKSGIKAGDELLMVDYKTVQFLNLNGINRQLLKGDGKKLVLVIRRQNEIMKVELMLRKMI
jgi:C-terminal processing protease CtpA/Prc